MTKEWQPWRWRSRLVTPFHSIRLSLLTCLSGISGIIPMLMIMQMVMTMVTVAHADALPPPPAPVNTVNTQTVAQPPQLTTPAQMGTQTATPQTQTTTQPPQPFPLQTAQPQNVLTPTISQQAATLCSACHGDKGNSLTPAWPKIAGLDVDYTLKQLQAFKKNQTGCRENVIMANALANLSDEDLQHLARYYSQQTMSPGSADVSNLVLGEQLYRAGNKHKNIPACLACHGPRGQGLASAQTPRVSGQQAEYIVSQLQAYRSGKRCTDPNRIMRTIAARLSDEEIHAVANYIQGLY